MLKNLRKFNTKRSISEAMIGFAKSALEGIVELGFPKSNYI